MVTVELNRDGTLNNIIINNLVGEQRLSDEVVSIIKRGEPYVDVMKSFNSPLKFQLYFQVQTSH
ncbi:hypothetical protein JCM13304A_22290 [Desulfothermus okinawensis JCM 13304]